MALGIDLTSIYTGLKELKHAVCAVTKQLKPMNSFCHKACVLTKNWIQRDECITEHDFRTRALIGYKVIFYFCVLFSQ